LTKHRFGIAQHFIIPEPQHAKPLIGKPAAALDIRLSAIVLATIDLNDQFSLEADEIDNVSPHNCLSLEFDSVKTMGAQQIP